jgi:hypothetical protein
MCQGVATGDAKALRLPKSFIRGALHRWGVSVDCGGNAAALKEKVAWARARKH